MREVLAPNRARTFSEAERLDGIVFDVAGGEAALHTSRSPDGESANEDSAALLVTGADSALLAVADGMGGARAGHRASAEAIRCLVEAVQAAVGSGASARSGIIDGFERANQVVLDLGVGAATTLSAVEISDATVRPYHVGDSFVLIAGQRGRIKLQTIPHSPVGYGIESGLLDEHAAMHHEERHLVSNAIGSAEMRIDVGAPRVLAPHDTLVLASDGLSDNLRTSEIVECVRRGPLESASRELLRLAEQRMRSGHTASADPSKPDDLTFLIYRRRQRRG